MKIRLFVFALAAVFAGQAFAQQSMAAFTPAQREAVQAYIKKTPNTFFKAESSWHNGDTAALGGARYYFGKRWRPFFATGDFNGDKLPDFVVLLGNRSDYETGRFVIFNGIPGGKYRVAYQELTEISYASFVDSRGGVAALRIFESDVSACFKPRGQTYRGGPCR